MCCVGKHRINRSIFVPSFPMSNRMRKRMMRKTSYQRTKEAFETVKEKRRKKKEVRKKGW